MADVGRHQRGAVVPHHPPDVRVIALVDHAHRALAEHFGDLVLAETFGVVHGSDLRGHAVGGRHHGALRVIGQLSSIFIAWTTLVFALVMYVADKAFLTVRRMDQMTATNAFLIGCAHVVDLAMEVAAARALADVVRPDQLNAAFIVPSVFDPEVSHAVAGAVRASVEARA